MDEGKIFRRAAWRLIPFMVAAYMLGWLDRVNVGFAALTMNTDLGFSPAVFGLGAGIFFIGYFLCQVPANVLLARIGARRWNFLALLAWGAVSAATAFVHGPAGFYALRFLLGLAEAGFFPGMVFYLTLWFPESYRARFTAGFMVAIPIASIIGGPLSGFILGMNGASGLHGWQWLFLIEGLPACAAAFLALWLLPDSPSQARWLSPDEKAMIASRLAAENRSKPAALWPALRDGRVLALSLVALCLGFGGTGIALWLPQILQSMGFANMATGLVVAAFSLAGAVAMILWGRSSDAQGERIWHVIWPVLLAAAGFLVAGIAPGNAVILASLACVAIGLLAADGPFFALPSSFLGGTAAAGGIALINAVGSLGAFLGPVVVGLAKQKTGGYAFGMTMLAASLILGACIVLALGRKMPPSLGVSEAARRP